MLAALLDLLVRWLLCYLAAVGAMLRAVAGAVFDASAVGAASIAVELGSGLVSPLLRVAALAVGLLTLLWLAFAVVRQRRRSTSSHAGSVPSPRRSM